jgi:hypothetical protein
MAAESNRASPTDGGRGRLPRRTPRRVALVFVAIAAVVLVVFGVILVSYYADRKQAGPSDFAPASWATAPPGSAGCQSQTREICFTAEVSSSFQNLSIASLSFIVNATPIPYNASMTGVLGNGSTVTILTAGGANGVWNMTTGNWTTPPSGLVPTSSYLVVVLDTDLQSNATLQDQYFLVQLPSSIWGAVGFPLSYPIP